MVLPCPHAKKKGSLPAGLLAELDDTAALTPKQLRKKKAEEEKAAKAAAQAAKETARAASKAAKAAQAADAASSSSSSSSSTAGAPDASSSATKSGGKGGKGKGKKGKGKQMEEELVLAGDEEDGDDEKEPANELRFVEGPVGSTSGIRLTNVSMAFRTQMVLSDVSWEVKAGEKVGLVGVNGAGKTTQLQIIMGNLIPLSGEIARAKRDMKIAYLKQEFDVEGSRTVREEFRSVFTEANRANRRVEAIQKELESPEIQEDMDRMTLLLDELQKQQRILESLDVATLDSKIDKMMPELGFVKEDADRLVAGYSGGWQMRMMLGKLLLQDPDLLLLDEPTNHIDLDTIEWLENYLRAQEIPMVVVSHDREFLDQLCTKIVETERGVSTTYQGNYTAYLRQKEEKIAQQYAAFTKQQKEIKKLRELIQKLSGGAQSGRAAQAQKVR